jgi:hypothetical protein
MGGGVKSLSSFDAAQLISTKFYVAVIHTNDCLTNLILGSCRSELDSTTRALTQVEVPGLLRIHLSPAPPPSKEGRTKCTTFLNALTHDEI